MDIPSIAPQEAYRTVIVALAIFKLSSASFDGLAGS
jgi:hypothetical protein